ncbi:MAG: hypothetical protein JWR85_3652 [Marmoricola sp.]|nr:hypothetical protein [Marmoricola sp.]
MSLSISHIKYYRYLNEEVGENKCIPFIAKKLISHFGIDNLFADKIAKDWAEKSDEIIEHFSAELAEDQDGEEDEENEHDDEMDSDDKAEDQSETSSSSSSSGEQVSNVWSESVTYDAGTRVAFKRRVYEAKRTTNGHPTSKYDWKVLPKQVAFVKKVVKDKVRKVKEVQIKKKEKKEKKPVAKLTEMIFILEQVLGRLTSL